VQSDIPIKRVLQIKTEDWVTFVFPEQTQVSLTDMKSDLVPRIKRESLMDNVKWLNNSSIVHFEPMGYKDEGLPARMLRYRSDIWEYTASQKNGFPSIKQAVIFFFEKHDNGIHHLSDDTFDYRYKVIKVWEIEGTEIVDKKLIGLYPLLPLTIHKKQLSNEDIIKSAVATINTVSDPVCKADLLATMSILAAEKYSTDFIRTYVRRDMLMQSELLNEWISEFVEEAKEEGKTQIAVKLLKKGHPPDYVAEIVDFPIDKVKKLTDDTKR